MNPVLIEAFWDSCSLCAIEPLRGSRYDRLYRASAQGNPNLGLRTRRTCAQPALELNPPRSRRCIDSAVRIAVPRQLIGLGLVEVSGEHSVVVEPPVVVPIHMRAIGGLPRTLLGSTQPARADNPPRANVATTAYPMRMLFM